MAALIHQRCFNHARREAAGICLACGRCFCRECLVEHEGKLTCANCLRVQARPPLRRRAVFSVAVQLVQIGLGLGLAWLVFYLVGSVLLALPTTFHEGTFWEEWSG